MHFWAMDVSLAIVNHELGISKRTIVDWLNFFREICSQYVAQQNTPIGGPGKTVEIDESVFCCILIVNFTKQPLIGRFRFKGNTANNFGPKVSARHSYSQYMLAAVQHTNNIGHQPSTGPCHPRPSPWNGCTLRSKPKFSRMFSTLFSLSFIVFRRCFL